VVPIQVFFIRVYNTSKASKNFSRKDAKTQRKDEVLFMILLLFFASFAALRETPCF
jgi:hypothetical protein